MPAFRMIALCVGAGVIGYLGWSGNVHWARASLVFPFLYLQCRSRLDAVSASFYYASATWSVIPGASVFFGTHAGPLLPILLWLGCIALGSAPWVALFNHRFVEVSALAALVVLAIPPLSLVTVAHPLICLGLWFPAVRWLGIILPLSMILVHRWLGFRYAAAVLLAAAIAAHVKWSPPAANLHLVAVRTQFGGSGFVPRSPTELYQQERSIENEALSHPDSVVLFPETAVPAWSQATDDHWRDTLRRLEQQRTTLLLGTSIPIPNSIGNRNILLTRGFGPHFAYVQRVPVPIAMWHFGDSGGYPLMLHYPPTIRVLNQRAAVLMCYEQLVVWPALQSLAHDPDLLLAPSNDYWAARTSIPAIQHIAAKSWADLWDIPLYEARNE